MKRTTLLAILLLGLSVANSAADTLVTQSFDLGTGWSSVYLEVQPNPRTPAEVFAPIAGDVESVWAYLDPGATIQYLIDPAEIGWNDPGWHVWFPAHSEQAFLTNLYAVFGNTAYLIKMRSGGFLSVTGVPTVDRGDWIGDSFNLRGFRVNPENPPTFADYFAPSAAHAGQPIYRLSNEGRYGLIERPHAEPIQSGAAYWIYTTGASAYLGPIRYWLPMYDGVHFGSELTRLRLVMQNVSDQTRTLTLHFEDPNIVLEYERYDPSAGYFTWIAIADVGPVDLAPSDYWNIRLAVRREGMDSGDFTGFLEISDGQGLRMRLPVAVHKDG